MSVPFVAAYSATKFGVEAISDALRVELRPWAIKVACIEPGSIATPMPDRGRDALLGRYMGLDRKT
jgi:short-subunit dehydrogenase